MNENAKDLESALQEHIDHINDAIIKTRQNELINLEGMDEKVATLCKEIMHTDDEAMAKLEDKMVHMINLLDELAIELKNYQERHG